MKCKIIINNKDDAKDGLLLKKKRDTELKHCSSWGWRQWWGWEDEDEVRFSAFSGKANSRFQTWTAFIKLI